MNPQVVGVHCRADGEPVPRGLAERFAASLGLAAGRTASLHLHGGCWLAATGVPARGWQATQLPDGSRLLFCGFLEDRQALADRFGIERGGDAAIYAAGFARYGGRVDLELYGQFATIIVDPEGARLRLSRSPVTGPPLHYVVAGGVAMAASVARALHATGEVERRMDTLKFDQSLLLNFCDNERSWFEGIRRVPAGHVLELVPGTAAPPPRRYYSFNRVPSVQMADDDAYVAQANALFDQAVTNALDGFARPAISLSGGLDSQAVAASTLRQHPGRTLYGFTSVPEPGWDGRLVTKRFGDERHHVAALAELYPDLSVDYVDAAGLSFDHRVESLFLLGGFAPSSASNMHWIHEIYRRAREKGCDVMLGGDYGNGSFSYSGFGALPGWLAHGQWRRLWQELGWSRGRRSRPYALMTQAVLPLLPPAIRRAVAEFRGAPTRDRYRGWCPLRQDYVAATGLEANARELGFDPDFLGPWRSRQWRTEFYEQGEAERADVRQAFCELHQLPFRDPCSSRRLVEFCLAIPDDQFVRQGQSRWLARRMLRGRVPDMVVEERRIGRQAADWMLRIRRQRPELIEELRSMEQDPFLADRIDLAGLRQALETMPEETPIDSPEAFRLQLALPRAMTAARFYRFVEGRNR